MSYSTGRSRLTPFFLKNKISTLTYSALISPTIIWGIQLHPLEVNSQFLIRYVSASSIQKKVFPCPWCSAYTWRKWTTLFIHSFLVLHFLETILNHARVFFISEIPNETNAVHYELFPVAKDAILHSHWTFSLCSITSKK
jgi:hypothetical protein